MRVSFLNKNWTSILLFLVIIVWTADRLRADPAAAKTGFIVTVGDVPVGLQNRAVQTFPFLETPSSPVPTYRSSSGKVIQGIQQAAVRYQVMNEVMQDPSCVAYPTPIRTLTVQVKEAIDGMEEEQSVRLLQDIWKRFSCETEVVDRAVYAQALFLAGSLAVYQGLDGVAFMTEAFLLDPTMPFPSKAERGIQDAYKQGRTKAISRSTSQVSIQRDQLEGLSLWVDGNPVTSTRITLPLGRHFVQLAGGDNRVIIGKIEEIATSSTDIPIWPTATMRPPSFASLEALFQRAARQKAVPPELGELLIHWLDVQQSPYLVLLVPGSSNDAAEAMLIQPGAAVRTGTVRNGTVRNGTEKNGTEKNGTEKNGTSSMPQTVYSKAEKKQTAPGVTRTLALASVTTVGLSTYGALCAVYCGANGNSAEPGSFEDRLVRAGSGTALVTAIVGALATSVSASVTWRFPRPLYAKRSTDALQLQARFGQLTQLEWHSSQHFNPQVIFSFR